MKGWYDLSHTFAPGMPVPDWPGERNQEFKLESFHMDRTGGNQHFAHLNLHCGTHVDAAGHYAIRGGSVDQLPFERLMGTCFVADLEREPLGSISIADLREYEDIFRQTDMFFIRTGWEEHWSAGDYDTKYPFLQEDVGKYLVDAGVEVLGLDTPGPDAPLRSGFRNGSPLHFDLLGNEVIIVENLANLKSVAGRSIYVYAFPIKIEGSFGGPARVIARELQAE